MFAVVGSLLTNWDLVAIGVFASFIATRRTRGCKYLSSQETVPSTYPRPEATGVPHAATSK
jgi:hypothetical protein